ncbi:R3H and coiled-coil domain-containing protein [Trifolium repens]|nr:R3H and coiled-coil domain-containing protein [Trifolium repens]
MEKEEATVNRRESNIGDAATTLDKPVLPPTNPASQDSLGNGSSAAAAADDDDDWEAIADLEPDKLLSPVSSDILTGVSNIKLVDTKSQTPKRRGRGTFSYDKDKLYSDRILDGSIIDNIEEEETQCSSEDKKDTPNSKYGTGHVLVLSHFSPSTRTTDLEKIFEDIKNCDFVIRWVNDTVALAVFRTPAEALEGQSNGRCSFNLSMRILDEDDVLLSSIKANDLKPPQQRPKTSAKAAQRMIANSMGIKLPSPSHGTGPREHKRQEDIRRDRIVNRQKLKDEAWGDD